MADNIKSVSIGEMVVSNKVSDVLVAYGLGSCVAVSMYDPVKRVSGMVHALLPKTASGGTKQNPYKFVDQGVPLLLKEVEKLGAVKSRLIVKVVGGAQMLSAAGFSDTLNIGKRNSEAAKVVLKSMGLRIRAIDTGGSSGRTVKLYTLDGKFTVKTLGKGEVVLD